MFGDDNWQINFFAEGAGGVRVILNNSLQDGVAGVKPVEIKISLQLIGNTPVYSGFPPKFGEISEFMLTDFKLQGGTVRGISPRETCQPGPGSGGGIETFTLVTPITLTIQGPA